MRRDSDVMKRPAEGLGYQANQLGSLGDYSRGAANYPQTQNQVSSEPQTQAGPEIPNLISQINSQMSQLHDRFSIMESRLAGYTAPPCPSDPVVKTAPSPLTDVGSSLRNILDGLDHLESRMIDFLDRLQV